MSIQAPLENVARRLSTTTDKLLHFHERGWVSVLDKSDLLLLGGRDEYKARFILHLERALNLTDDQIAKVLSTQEPPYTLAGIEEILSETV